MSRLVFSQSSSTNQVRLGGLRAGRSFRIGLVGGNLRKSPRKGVAPVSSAGAGTGLALCAAVVVLVLVGLSTVFSVCSFILLLSSIRLTGTVLRSWSGATGRAFFGLARLTVVASAPLFGKAAWLAALIPVTLCDMKAIDTVKTHNPNAKPLRAGKVRGFISAWFKSDNELSFLPVLRDVLKLGQFCGSACGARLLSTVFSLLQYLKSGLSARCSFWRIILSSL
jgi:hypothetical protein